MRSSGLVMVGFVGVACSPATVSTSDAGSAGGTAGGIVRGVGGGDAPGVGGGEVAGGSVAGGVAGGLGSGGGLSGGGGATAGGSAGGMAMVSDAGIASSCAGRSYALCEDFESASPAILPMGWSEARSFGSGTVQVSTQSAHGGTRALKSTSSAAGQPRIQHALAPMLGGNHWGRLWYRVEVPAPKAQNMGNYFHITFLALQANNAESRVVDTVQSPIGTISYLYNIPDDSCCNSSSYSWRFDGNWHCTEWYVNNATDSYRFFLDGMEIQNMAFSGRTGARLQDFTRVVLGALYYVPSNGTLTAWVDDLAVDVNRIGCQ